MSASNGWLCGEATGHQRSQSASTAAADWKEILTGRSASHWPRKDVAFEVGNAKVYRGLRSANVRRSGGEGLHPGQHLVGGDEPRTQRLEFVEGLPAFLGIQSLDRIADDADAPPALQQAFGRETYAVLRDHAEDGNFRGERKTLYQGLGVAALEDVERLLLKQNLLEMREHTGQTRRPTIGHPGYSNRYGLEYIIRADDCL